MTDRNKKEIPFILISILEKESSKNHVLSMPDLIARLAENSISCTRQTISSYLKLIDQDYKKIHFVKRNGQQGYWLEQPLTKAEIVFLRDVVGSSFALSKKSSAALIHKIDAFLSADERNKLPQVHFSTLKTDNSEVLEMMEELLNAIENVYPVSFRYYDWTISKEKKYRRNKERYQMVPYAIVFDNGRIYCVFYSDKHSGFANFRLDKMDSLKVQKESANSVPFSLKNWLNHSFQMYAGKQETVIITFHEDMANIVFDEFGKNLLITQKQDHTFTAAISTAVTPTLVSWLFQFSDRLVVQEPDSLISEMKRIASSILATYNK